MAFNIRLILHNEIRRIGRVAVVGTVEVLLYDLLLEGREHVGTTTAFWAVLLLCRRVGGGRSWEL